jgi:hypothetical protein
MTFVKALTDTRGKFQHTGRFTLQSSESINNVVKRERIPNERGAYIICKCDDHCTTLHIGKAGTLNQDGSWKDQGIAERLTRKQDGIYRREYFLRLMKNEATAGLTFEWFVTHDANTKVIPALVELILLQAYFDQYACLPKLNRCV